MRRHPAHVSERKRPSPWDDCTLCADAMAIDAATAGRITPTRYQVRLESGVTDHVGLSDGTNLSDAARAMDRIAPALRLERPQTGLRLTTDEILARGKAEDVVFIFQGLYSRLPAHFSRWDPEFARLGNRSTHATFGMWDGVGWWWIDPLGPDDGSYQGEYIDEAALRAFLDGLDYDGHNHRYVGVIEAIVPLEPPPPAPVPAPAPEDRKVKFVLAEGYGVDALPLRVDAPAGTQIFELDSDVPWTSLKTPSPLITDGLADGHTGDFHVVVSTGRFAPDTERRDYWQRARIPQGKPRARRDSDPR